MQYKYIAVDFDGTLNEHAFPEIGEPKPQTIAFVRYHAERGTKIILHTCRDNSPGGRQYLTEAVEWCRGHGIPIHAVNENPFVDFGRSGKIYADIYVDDRAVPVCDISPETNFDAIRAAASTAEMVIALNGNEKRFCPYEYKPGAECGRNPCGRCISEWLMQKRSVSGWE